MPEFKAKAVHIQHKRQWTSKHGNEIHVFSVTFEREDGQQASGVFTTTKADQTKFKLNEMVMIKTSTTQEDHKNVTKFDKVSEDSSGSGGYRGGGNSRSNPEKDRAIVANVSILCATRMIINSGKGEAVKDDLSAIKGIADKIYKYIMNKANGDTQVSITTQAQMKIISEFFYEFPNVTLDTSDQVLEAANKLIEWVLGKAKG